MYVRSGTAERKYYISPFMVSAPLISPLSELGIGEDDPEEEQIFRDLWEDESQCEVVIESLKADCEVRAGRPPGL